MIISSPAALLTAEPELDIANVLFHMTQMSLDQKSSLKNLQQERLQKTATGGY